MKPIDEKAERLDAKPPKPVDRTPGPKRINMYCAICKEQFKGLRGDNTPEHGDGTCKGIGTTMVVGIP